MKEVPLKDRVRRFWDSSPCGMKEVAGIPGGTRKFFKSIEKKRYTGDDFMPGLVGFARCGGKRVLEVGCGIGADLVQFSKAGARVCGVDVSFRSAALAGRWLDLEGLAGLPLQSDAEALPFKENTFDLVYSWGVLHHIPDTQKAIQEVVRVCKEGGEVFAMLYHRHSLVALQVWLRFGLLKGRSWVGVRRLMAEHMESPGTQVFSRQEALQMFSRLKEVRVRTVVTRYDLRIGRRCFLPRFLRRWIPARWGWFLVVQAKK